MKEVKRRYDVYITDDECPWADVDPRISVNCASILEARRVAKRFIKQWDLQGAQIVKIEPVA